MAAWRHILCSLDGTEQGELFQARDRQLALPLNGLATAGFTLDLDNPMVDAILGATSLQRLNLLLKIYRNGTRLFVGPLVSAEEAVTEPEGSLSVAAASPLWYLFRRLVGLTVAGYGDGTPLATKDLGVIAKNMIDVANAGGDTGIRPGSIGASTSSYVGPWYLKKIAEAIIEIGPATLGGFDFELVPVEPVADAGGVKLATFNTYGTLGVDRPNAVFEYGVGKRNVGSARRPMTADALANKLYHLAPGFPDSIEAGITPVLSSTSAASVAARGLHEDVVNADLGVSFLRQLLLDESIRIRKQPRELVMFTPIPNCEPDYGDYLVGDTVVGRAVFRGRTLYDAVFRVYGINFGVDDMGTEVVDLTLVNEAA